MFIYSPFAFHSSKKSNLYWTDEWRPSAGSRPWHNSINLSSNFVTQSTTATSITVGCFCPHWRFPNTHLLTEILAHSLFLSPVFKVVWVSSQVLAKSFDQSTFSIRIHTKRINNGPNFPLFSTSFVLPGCHHPPHWTWLPSLWLAGILLAKGVGNYAEGWRERMCLLSSYPMKQG